MKKKGEFESLLGMNPLCSWGGMPIVLWPNR
jgi:hypothetical protein